MKFLKIRCTDCLATTGIDVYNIQPKACCCHCGSRQVSYDTKIIKPTSIISDENVPWFKYGPFNGNIILKRIHDGAIRVCEKDYVNIPTSKRLLEFLAKLFDNN